MGSRSQRVLAELGRFFAVGGLATVVALVLFNLLVHGIAGGRGAVLADQPILAYVIANSIGMVISFSGSRNWAFRDRPTQHADGGFTAYVLINVATMALPVALLTFSRSVLGLSDPVSDNVSANLIGGLAGFGARFYLFRTFVFKRPIHVTDLYHTDEIILPTAPTRVPSTRGRAQRPTP